LRRKHYSDSPEPALVSSKLPLPGVKFPPDISMTTPVLILTKDRKQAMDWSLALASQGISVTIVEPEPGAYALQVEPADSTRAFQTLKLYHVENRRWDWWLQHQDDGPRFEPLAFLWIAALICWHSLAAHDPVLTLAGVMNSGRFALGEWWRLFTAVTLHHDLAHLVSNTTTGLLLFGLAAARYGLGISLLASYLAGVAGNLLGWLYYSGDYQSLGASGMVLGALGLLITRPLLGEGVASLRYKRLFIAVSAGFLLFVLLGASPESDLAAHAGGFVAGIGLGWMLRRLPLKKSPPQVQGLALACFLALLVLTWWLALR
jgi:membrane associated rhomboid family serine protease